MLGKWKTFALDLFPEPEDVYAAIRPLYICCKVLGLACYTTKTGRRKRYSVTPTSFVQQVLTVSLLTGLCCYNFFTQPFGFSGTELMRKLQYVQDVISNLLMATEMLFVFVFAKKLVQVFKNIDEVDKWFKSLGVVVSYKHAYINALGSVVIGMILTTAGVVVIWTFYDGTEFLLLFLLRAVINLCPYAINFTCQTQYVQYMAVLTMKYKLLNRYLKTLLHDEEKPNAKITAWAVKSEKFRASGKGGGDAVSVVHKAAALHIRLNETALLINHAFNVQLLLSITIAFIGLVTALFLIAVNFSRPSTGADSNLNFMFTTWAFSIALFLMWTVSVTCNLCEKANKCPRILHRIRNVSFDADLNETIEIYSLQMHHSRLQFHVCGLFPLDYTLLYTIVAGITTYLVILIQFNNAPYTPKADNVTVATN